jgi:heptosyltransferase-1
VPVLASLRHAWPDAQIDWIVQDSFQQVIQPHPAITNVIPFQRNIFSPALKVLTSFPTVIGWLEQLRRTRYDLVLDCQGLGRSGLMAWWTRAPRRIGDREAREFAWLGCNIRHQVQPIDAPPIHTVDRMLALLKAENIDIVHDMRLYVPMQDQQWWQTQCESHEMQPGRYAVLAPGARWLSKCWPIERWPELVRPLLERGYEHIVLVGGPDEVDHIKPIAHLCEPSQSPLINLVGQTSIGQMMAVIANAGFLIGNDSAPLHMAVGFDRPCIGLFGPTDPTIVGPYRKPHAAIREFVPAPSDRIDHKDPKLGDRLMRVISTQRVVQQIDRVLELESSRLPLPEPCVGECP